MRSYPSLCKLLHVTKLRGFKVVHEHKVHCVTANEESESLRINRNQPVKLAQFPFGKYELELLLPTMSVCTKIGSRLSCNKNTLRFTNLTQVVDRLKESDLHIVLSMTNFGSFGSELEIL